MNEKVASQICKTKSIIAQKVIRFCNLSDVKIINEGNKDDLKTIVLFRDPRGIFSSRKRLLGAEFGAKFGVEAARQSVSSAWFHASTLNDEKSLSMIWTGFLSKFAFLRSCLGENFSFLDP